MIFSTEAYDYLAAELAQLTSLERGTVERDDFPDGEHYLRVASDVTDAEVVLVGGKGIAALVMPSIGDAVAVNSSTGRERSVEGGGGGGWRLHGGG